ncbi:MAG: sulfatase-like hydrolase/transferase [Candidatus Aminicenantes bacterium]|nr:sulfatase-like hydrolase/transferase [Candidatus Aminicenantes bacterium]
MNKKILVFGSVFVIVLVCVAYIIFLRDKGVETPGPVRVSKSIQSMLGEIDISDMNIVLFTIDTLRADHLECYGYGGVSTPHINRLAEEGILFEHNIVQTPLTLPSHSSIMTGTYPLYHGIRDNGGFYLDAKHDTLAETLKPMGFQTGAFVAAFVLDSRWGLDQGFDHYFDNFDLTKYKTVSLDAVQRRGDEVLDAVYPWLSAKPQQKFFAWIHLYDPHTPYDPPEPYKTEYRNRRFGLYDGEIAYVDQLIGEFRQFMQENGFWENTLIVFTADHGESLGEHKENAHGFFIYDSDVRVPLIIRFPQAKLGGRRIKNQVRSVDIMPTILNIVGAGIPPAVQGQSMLPILSGDEADSERLAYSETYWPNFHYGWSELKSVRKGQYKFIQAPRPEIYDVWQDPGELTDIVNVKASLGYDMKRELDELVARYSAKDIDEIKPQKMDQDSLVKLQALGYLGSFRTSPRKTGERLADPKDKIELYNEIKVAQFLSTEEKMDEAEQKIQDVLSKDPFVLEARYILGNIYAKQKKYEEAIEEFKAALGVDSEYYEAIFGIAVAYMHLGKKDEAVLGFLRLREMDPRDTKPLLQLADIYEDRGEDDEAMNCLKLAVEIDPEAPVFHNKLGALYLKKNMLDAAEKEINKALSIERSIPLTNAHFNLALLYEARGQVDLAVQEYEKEKETSPYNYKPYFNLGLLYAKAEDNERAIQEFEGCIEKNENFPDAHVFLGKAYMDSGRDLTEAEKLTLKGLELKPETRTTILGHLVLADIYNRMGRIRESQQQLGIAKDLRKNL